MQSVTHLLRLLVWMFLCCLIIETRLAHAVQIQGRVTQVRGETIELASDSELLPRVGDKVEIVIELKAIKSTALVTTGTVTGVNANAILVRIDNPKASVLAGQLAKIDSAQPVKKSESVPTPPAGMNEPAVPQQPGAPESAVYKIPDSVLYAVGFSDDGRRVLACAGQKVVVWDIAGKELNQFPLGDEVIEDAAFSPDGRFVLTGNTGGDATIRDTTTGQEVHRLHCDSWMHSVAYAADGSRFLAGTGSYSLKIDENPIGAKGQDEFAMVLWDANNGTELARYTGNRFAVSASAYSPDGRFVAAGCKDGSVHVWELATGGNLFNFLETSFAVSSVDFSPDGRYLLVAGGEGAELDQERLERELANLPGPGAPPPDPPSATEHYLSVDDRVLHVIEITTDNEVQLQGHQTPVGEAVFSPDGKRILSGASDQTVRLWDVASGKEVANFAGHTSSVRRVAFSRDGKFALSGDVGGEVRLWKLP